MQEGYTFPIELLIQGVHDDFVRHLERGVKDVRRFNLHLLCGYQCACRATRQHYLDTLLPLLHILLAQQLNPFDESLATKHLPLFHNLARLHAPDRYIGRLWQARFLHLLDCLPEPFSTQCINGLVERLFALDEHDAGGFYRITVFSRELAGMCETLRLATQGDDWVAVDEACQQHRRLAGLLSGAVSELFASIKVSDKASLVARYREALKTVQTKLFAPLSAKQRDALLLDWFGRILCDVDFFALESRKRLILLGLSRGKSEPSGWHALWNVDSLAVHCGRFFERHIISPVPDYWSRLAVFRGQLTSETTFGCYLPISTIDSLLFNRAVNNLVAMAPTMSDQALQDVVQRHLTSLTAAQWDEIIDALLALADLLVNRQMHRTLVRQFCHDCFLLKCLQRAHSPVRQDELISRLDGEFVHSSEALEIFSHGGSLAALLIDASAHHRLSPQSRDTFTEYSVRIAMQIRDMTTGELLNFIELAAALLPVPMWPASIGGHLYETIRDTWVAHVDCLFVCNESDSHLLRNLLLCAIDPGRYWGAWRLAQLKIDIEHEIAHATVTCDPPRPWQCRRCDESYERCLERTLTLCRTQKLDKEVGQIVALLEQYRTLRFIRETPLREPCKGVLPAVCDDVDEGEEYDSIELAQDWSSDDDGATDFS